MNPPFFPLFRNRIVSAAAERVAPQQAEQGQTAPFYNPEPLDRLDSIIGTGGNIFTAWLFHGRNIFLVKTYEPEKNPFHCRTPASRSCFSIALAMSVLFTCGVRARATNTRSKPGFTRGAIVRKASRITRRDRLRLTAFPVFLLVVIPTRRLRVRFFIT